MSQGPHKKPGQNVGSNGGIYQQVGPRGGQKHNFAAVSDHRRLPPTSKPGHRWKLVRRTPNSRRKSVR